jgi:hypothetical protein
MHPALSALENLQGAGTVTSALHYRIRSCQILVTGKQQKRPRGPKTRTRSGSGRPVDLLLLMDSGIQRSRSTEAPYRSICRQERRRWIRFCLDLRLARFCEAAKRYWAWVCLRYAPRPAPVWGRLASRPQLVFPADLAPRCLRLGLPTPPPAFLPCWPLLSAQQPKVVPCGGQVHLGGSRRARVVFCQLRTCDVRLRVACRGVCVSACPWRLPAGPTAQPVPQGNQTGQSPLGKR